MSLNPRTFLPLTLLVLVVGAAAPAAAPAAVRLASPTSIDTAGTCLITACRLDRALAVAGPGDEVALEDGVPYSVSYEAKASAAVTIRPATPGTQPRVIGGAGLAFPTLKLAAGGTVTGLRLESASNNQVALYLADGARGVGLELYAGSNTGAHAARLESAPGTTALINSFARSASTYTAVEIIDGATPGGAALVNVTAVSTGSSSWGVTTDMATQSPIVKNSIIRAPSKNFHARANSGPSQPIAVSNSNFVVGTSSGWTDVANNQKDVAVTFTDSATDDYRPVPGAPTIDSGATDALITATIDPDGRARTLGSAPDMGAYEYDSGATPPPAADDTSTETDTTPRGTTTTTTTPTTTTTVAPAPAPTTSYVAPDGTTVLAPASAPVLGAAVTVDAGRGTPLIKLPGAKKFVPLSEATSIPVGSTIDATKGHIRLTSVRDDQGRTQTGEFWGGRFVVRQAKDKVPYTDLVLTGSSFAGCPKVKKPRARAAGATAFAAASHKKKRKTVVRSLWGRDHRGRFRTRGRNSVATVRGTVWLVQDRCDGTLTRVTKGAVDVRESTGRVVRLRAGRSHLARRR